MSHGNSTAERIRVLNDELRQYLLGGVAVITPGIAALGQKAVERIVKTIAVYDDFCHANDPHEEHDFGSFEVDGQTVIFKIDYFDKILQYHSPDPVRSNRDRARDYDHAGGGILMVLKLAHVSPRDCSVQVRLIFPTILRLIELLQKCNRSINSILQASRAALPHCHISPFELPSHWAAKSFQHWFGWWTLTLWFFTAR